MQILDSFIDGAFEIDDIGDRKELVYAVVDFLRNGSEPSDLKGAAKAVWVSILPAIRKSRSRSLSGSKGASKRKANAVANANAKTGEGSGFAPLSYSYSNSKNQQGSAPRSQGAAPVPKPLTVADIEAREQAQREELERIRAMRERGELRG